MGMQVVGVGRTAEGGDIFVAVGTVQGDVRAEKVTGSDRGGRESFSIVPI